MKLRPRLAPPCAALALAALFHFAAAPAHAGPGDPDDVCRSAFEGDTRATERADKAAPIHMVLFGDSIMWGQGLKDRDKFWCRVQQWVELKTRRNVRVRQYAHAGAVIKHYDPDGKELDERNLRGGGEKKGPGGEGKDSSPVIGREVNISFPTIVEQVEQAVSDMRGEKGEGTEAQGINLVLVDGCINDVNFRRLLDVENGVPQIVKVTEERCGEMKGLLERITSAFPNAYVVVTGYYPLIFKGVTTEKGKKVVKGSAHNPVINLAIETLAGGGECKDRGGEGGRGRHKYDCLDALSRAWFETSNETLAAAVEGENGRIEEERRGRGLPAPAAHRVHFAELNFPPDFAFSTKQSMLWNLRLNATGVGGFRKFVILALDGIRFIETNDDRWDVRGDQCEQAFKDYAPRVRGHGEITAEQKEDFKRFFVFVCRRGSIGHPNKFGALLYAQSITARLQTILPATGWKMKDDAAPAGGGGEQPQP